MQFELIDNRTPAPKKAVEDSEDEKEHLRLVEQNRRNKIFGTVFENYVNLLLTKTKSENATLYFQRKLSELVDRYKNHYIIHFKKSGLYYIALSPFQAIEIFKKGDEYVENSTNFRLKKIFAGNEENPRFDKIIIERIRSVGNRPDSVIIDGDKIFVIDSKFRSHQLDFSYADIKNVLLYNDILKREKNIRTRNPPTIIFNLLQQTESNPGDQNEEDAPEKKSYKMDADDVEYLFKNHIILKTDINSLLKERLGRNDKITIIITDSEYTANSEVFGTFYKGIIKPPIHAPSLKDGVSTGDG